MSYCLKMYLLFVTFTALSFFLIKQLSNISTFSFSSLPLSVFSLTPRKVIYVYYYVSKVLADYVKFTYFFDTPCQNKNQSNRRFIHHHLTESESFKQQHFKSSQALVKHHYLYKLIRVREIVKTVDIREFISRVLREAYRNYCNASMSFP